MRARVRLSRQGSGKTSSGVGVELPAMPIKDYLDFASERIAQTVAQAWEKRAPGRIAYGMGSAVVGRNRRWVDTAGRATMYGNTNTETFSHIEGYEDHSIRTPLGRWLRAPNRRCSYAVTWCPYQTN